MYRKYDLFLAIDERETTTILIVGNQSDEKGGAGMTRGCLKNSGEMLWFKFLECLADWISGLISIERFLHVIAKATGKN